MTYFHGELLRREMGLLYLRPRFIPVNLISTTL